MVVAALPPKLDGIGDYTACIAKELAHRTPGCDVTIFTANDSIADPIAGVTVIPVFKPDDPASYWALVPAIVSADPDWLIVQYNPFSFGRRGMNLQLPRAIRRIRQCARRTKIAIMYHEMYVPVINWKFAVMAVWQRYQFYSLCSAAHVLMFSIDPWARHHQKRMPGKPIYHLPIGSAIRLEEIEKKEARYRLGIRDEECVLGMFGTAHASRLFHLVRKAAEKVGASGRAVRVLYIGPHGAQVRKSLGELPIIAEGPLPTEEVSRRLSAIDIFLAPYIDGVSSRRSAMMAALQHGLPTVGTMSYNTDAEFREASGQAICLIPTADESGFVDSVLRLAGDEVERNRLGLGALELFQRRFAWEAIAGDLLEIFKLNAG